MLRTLAFALTLFAGTVLAQGALHELDAMPPPLVYLDGNNSLNEATLDVGALRAESGFTAQDAEEASILLSDFTSTETSITFTVEATPATAELVVRYGPMVPPPRPDLTVLGPFSENPKTITISGLNPGNLWFVSGVALNASGEEIAWQNAQVFTPDAMYVTRLIYGDTADGLEQIVSGLMNGYENQITPHALSEEIYQRFRRSVETVIRQRFAERLQAEQSRLSQQIQFLSSN